MSAPSPPRTRRRRVLIWTECHSIGGAERFLADLLGDLDRRLWAVTLATNANPDLDRFLDERGALEGHDRAVVRVANLPASPLQRFRSALGVRSMEPAAMRPDDVFMVVDQGGLGRRALVAALRYRQLFANRRKMRRLLRSVKPDVVFLSNGGYPGAESCRAATLAAAVEGISVVHFVHGIPLAPFWPEAVEHRLDARIDGATHAWITSAGVIGRALVAARGIASDKVHTVPLGVRTDVVSEPLAASETGFAADALGLAMVARLTPTKGHLVLLDALALLRERGVDVRAAFTGLGPAKAEIASRVNQLGLDDRVRILGWQPEVTPLLAAADAFVLPTLNDSFPYAVLEAMAQGLPVVASAVGGIPEAVENGTSGIIVPPGDVQALAGALERLAGDRETAAAMGRSGRHRIEVRFSIARMTQETTALWA